MQLQPRRKPRPTPPPPSRKNLVESARSRHRRRRCVGPVLRIRTCHALISLLQVSDRVQNSRVLTEPEGISTRFVELGYPGSPCERAGSRRADAAVGKAVRAGRDTRYTGVASAVPTLLSQ